jgi:hypothetical protein
MKTLSPEQQAQIAKEDATPNDELTPGELKRKTDRIKKRESRDRLKAKKIANTAKGLHDFWESNRKAMNQTALSNLMVQHEAVLDQLYWMDYGENVPPEDPDFVSLQEGIDDLLRFVKEHGVVHLGFISKNDLPADWMCRPFWQDSELMARLKDENPQTETYVMYGLFAALPDWRVIEFLTKKTGAAWSWQKAADFVGYRIVGNTCCYGRGKTLFEAWGHAEEVKTPPAKPVTTTHIPE